MFRSGQDDRERQTLVVRMHEDAQQIEELFRRTGTAREDDDAVADTHERFQTFLDVRQNHQLIDDRVWRFGSDDARLGQTEIATAVNTLFGVGDGRAFHRALHHAGAAAGADVEAAQAQFVADFLGVFVFFGVDRVTAPAHDDFRLDTRAQGAGIAQQMKDVIADALGGAEIDALAVEFVFGVDDVSQGAEQHFPGAGDHLAVDEGIGRSVQQLKAHTAILLVNADFEVLVGFKNGLGVIDMSAGVEDGQGALAEQGVGAAGSGFTQLLHFTLRKGFQAAFGADRSIDYVSLGHAMILKTMSSQNQANGIRIVCIHE
ncbi:hypothetical protein PS732_04967 [Pseudomonas fluorescens]|uniref:Uncharacterized protein n=1 Tax=Pseudomonas fluorescens TaxID=294 RepID=A0ABD7VMR5_PSEFL|nr:hypothetical protein PS732_04967 [Pseudomonas fluorescens]